MEFQEARAARDTITTNQILAGQTTDECVSMLQPEFVTQSPVRVKAGRTRIDGQHGLPMDSHENIVAERDDCMAHIEEAKSAEPPDESSIDDPHLMGAIRYVSSHAQRPQDLIDERLRKLQLLETVSKKMAPKTAAARHLATEWAYPVAKRFNIGLFAVMLEAASYPDVNMATDLVVGVQNIGDIQASGSHAPSFVPASVDELDPAYPARLIGRIRRKAANAQGDVLQGYYDCYDKTMAEVRNGWMAGPFTKDDMDNSFPQGWHCSERFAQYRYPGAPCRPCDNFRTSKINDFNTYHERLVCENAAFPARVGRAFFDILGGDFPFAHGTDDLVKAYRQIIVRTHAYNVIAIWNPYQRRVEFFVIRGLPFGSAAAVLQFNRYPILIAHFLAAFFGICCASYYDDYDVAEPKYSVHNAQFVLRRVHELLGFSLDPAKHVRAQISGVPFLGVISDFAHFSEGKIFLRVKPDRVQKVVSIMQAMIARGSVSPSEASSLRGKLFFCVLAAFNKLGRAPLRVLTARQYARVSHMTDELLECLHFFIALIPNMRPRVIDLLERLRPLLLLWTDAMFTGGAGSLGLIAFDVETSQFYYSYYYVPAWIYSFWRPLATYIGQLEILAVLFAYITLPRALVARKRIIHWVDNTSAVAGAIKGYSSKPDSSFMLALLHIIFAALAISPWFQYVASKANCSDGPSRGDFSIPAALGALWIPPVMLDLAQWRTPLSEWIPRPLERFAPRLSGAARRAARRQR